MSSGVWENLKTCLNASITVHTTKIAIVRKYKAVNLLRSKTLKRRMSKKSGGITTVASNKATINLSQYLVMLLKVFFITCVFKELNSTHWKFCFYSMIKNKVMQNSWLSKFKNSLRESNIWNLLIFR